MGKKKRKDLTEENVTNTDVVGFGEMAIQQTITNCSDIGKNTDAIVERIGANLKNIGAIEERIGAKLDHLIEWFTTQKRIDELNAELKMLDEQCKFLFPPYDAIAYDAVTLAIAYDAVDSRLRCKRDLRELEDEQRRLRREEQERLERLKEKAAVIIQAFLRTTAVRVKIDRAEHLWGRKHVRSWERCTPFTLGAAVRERACGCLLYTSDAADDTCCV